MMPSLRAISRMPHQNQKQNKKHETKEYWNLVKLGFSRFSGFFKNYAFP